MTFLESAEAVTFILSGLTLGAVVGLLAAITRVRG